MNQFYSRWAPRVPSEVTPRNVLIFCVIALLCLGSIMVASASMPYAERLHFHQVCQMIDFYLYDSVVCGHLYAVGRFAKSCSRDDFCQFLGVVQLGVR
jgi:cell division protein FtsW (lipid II flippase)